MRPDLCSLKMGSMVHRPAAGTYVTYTGVSVSFISETWRTFLPPSPQLVLTIALETLSVPMASVFPIEIFEHIINCVWEDDSDRRVRRRVLLACSITCRSFLCRSRYYLFRDISLRNHGQLYRFASLISSVPFIDSLVRELEISDAQVLRTFALMLARRLTSVERLHLTGRNQQLLALLRPDSLIPIPEFTSITKMQIFRTTFGSLADFGRLICALPNLSSLACVDVWWTKSHYNPIQFATKGRRVRLHSLEIELCPLDEMLGWFLAATSMSTLERLILPFASQHDMEPNKQITGKYSTLTTSFYCCFQ